MPNSLAQLSNKPRSYRLRLPTCIEMNYEGKFISQVMVDCRGPLITGGHF